MDEVPLPTPQSQPQPASADPASVAVPASIAPLTPEQAAALLGKPLVCPRCHLPVKPEYYYCPNCGAKITEPPIGVGVTDQLLLYAFSIVLPWIAYLAISKWQGIKYLRSPDSRAKQVGLIALILLIASSVIAFWLTIAWVQSYTQQSVNDLNNIGF